MFIFFIAFVLWMVYVCFFLSKHEEPFIILDAHGYMCIQESKISLSIKNELIKNDYFVANKNNLYDYIIINYMFENKQFTLATCQGYDMNVIPNHKKDEHLESIFYVKQYGSGECKIHVDVTNKLEKYIGPGLNFHNNIFINGPSEDNVQLYEDSIKIFHYIFSIEDMFDPSDKVDEYININTRSNVNYERISYNIQLKDYVPHDEFEEI